MCSHPLSNYWEASDDKTCTCSTCETAVGGLEYVADLCDGSPTKTYIFYQFSSNEVSITVSGGISGGITVSGGSASLSAGRAETIKLGSPMVKMLRQMVRSTNALPASKRPTPKSSRVLLCP